MAQNLDIEILAGFIAEAKNYLPEVRRGLAGFQTDQTQTEGLETAHRHIHTIKGAAAMVGLDELSHVAHELEQMLEQIGADLLAFDPEMMALLQQGIDEVEIYLDELVAGTGGADAAASEVVSPQPIPQENVADPFPTSVSAPQVQNGADVEPFLDEISSELLEAFQLEAEDHMRQINLSLSGLQKDPNNKTLLQDVRRAAHTLKGAAGTVGFTLISEVSHRMEDLLDQLYDGHMHLNSDMINLLFDSADALEDLSSGLSDPTEMQMTVQQLYAGYAMILDTGRHLNIDAPSVEPLGTEIKPEVIDLTPYYQEAAESSTTTQPETTPQDEANRRELGDVIRVPIERLDELIKLVSELVISRTAFEQRMGDLVSEVEELRPSIDRLRHVSSRLEVEYEVSTLGGGLRHLASPGRDVNLPKIGNGNGNALPASSLVASATTQTYDFDELEFDRYTEFHLLSRALTETTGDVNTVGNALKTLIGDFDSILNRQRRLSSELQEKLMRTRMVPLATLATRLHRAVRVVARKRDKQVNLVIEGEHIELDKTVLEDLADPLLHLLRNAVDHGIESPIQRQHLGKSEWGEIRLKAYYEGNQVVIQISDDGGGLNPEKLITKAIEGGYLSEADAPQIPLDKLHTLVFLPGFSTAGQISEISGRGVGLDVVKTNVNKLKGAVALNSTPGQGTTFTIRLPMTLAITRALLVKANSETLAIPLNTISQILRLEPEEFEQVGQEAVVRVAGEVYPLLRLGDILKLKQPPDDSVKRVPVLILNAGEQQVAVAVDHILQGREIVIKSLGSHLRRVHGIMGATLMGDGSVVLILNPAELVDEPAHLNFENEQLFQQPATTQRDVWDIMVVDDSVSVRRVVSNMVKNAGWQPTMAKDGLEALEIIQRSAQPPDLILLDIEMPRMDGYELAATLRGQQAYQDVPIVMLTSRAGDKHRRKALDIGVSEYMVKPYQDEVLLGVIRRLVQASKHFVTESML